MLTESQNKVLDELLVILETNDKARLIGSAGVGKTYLVNVFVQRLLSKYPMGLIYCTAPTNKAVRVLKEKVINNDRVKFLTTQKTLKLKRFIDNRTGKVYFKPEFSKSKDKPLDRAKVVIIDESSMLNTELTDILEDCAKQQKCKILYVGDDKQINPVGEPNSPVFIREYPTVMLTEIVRQAAGNPIINLSRDLSKIDLGIAEVAPEVGGYIYSNDIEKVITTLAHVNGSDDLKYLAYTNREVDFINKKVREAIYGNPSKIEKGEILVFDAPYKNVYINSEEIKVEEVQVKEFQFKILYEEDPVRGNEYKFPTLKCYSINPNKISNCSFKDNNSWEISKIEPGEEENILVIHEDSEEDFNKICVELASRAKSKIIPWTEFYRFSEDVFAKLRYNHALTIHKSQGSTFKQVILNHKDIKLNPNEEEVKRLIYTGVTRASNLLIIYNR